MTARPTSKQSTKLNNENLKDVRSIIAISSCKGGVGKSTIAANLAYDLARKGFRVGLLDTDIHGPSIPTLFGMNQTTPEISEKKMFIPPEKDGLKIMSTGFLFGDQATIMRGPIVTRYIQQILLATDWGTLDYLFIDMPPGTGDIQLTITQSIQLTGAVIITTPQTLSLLDVTKGILMYEKVNVPILGVIENMSYFICDSCDKKHYLFGKQGAQTLKLRFGIDILAELPLIIEWTKPIHKSKTSLYIENAVNKVIRAIGKNSQKNLTKPEITFDANQITLAWKGESIEKYSVQNLLLRQNCQCALCVSEMSGEQILDPNRIKKDIHAKEVTTLGNYAINVVWSDGHSSGVFPYPLLKELNVKTSPR